MQDKCFFLTPAFQFIAIQNNVYKFSWVDAGITAPPPSVLILCLDSTYHNVQMRIGVACIDRCDLPSYWLIFQTFCTRENKQSSLQHNHLWIWDLLMLDHPKQMYYNFCGEKVKANHLFPTWWCVLLEAVVWFSGKLYIQRIQLVLSKLEWRKEKVNTHLHLDSIFSFCWGFDGGFTTALTTIHLNWKIWSLMLLFFY